MGGGGGALMEASALDKKLLVRLFVLHLFPDGEGTY